VIIISFAIIFVLKIHGENRYFRIKEFKSRNILKDFERNIYIPEAIQIIPKAEQHSPTATINEILIKDQYSSSFFRFKIGDIRQEEI